MPISVSLVRKLEKVPPEIREVLLTMAEEMERSREESVTKVEFNELKGIVNELAEAQKRTEEKVNELAEAQKRTEEKVNELAEAQKKTEEKVNELAEAQRKTEEEIRKLTTGLHGTRRQIGGLSRSVAYALENEAYRNLPPFLKEKHSIEVLNRFVRFELDGEEINLFARARQNGEEIILVGEAVLRLDDESKLKKVKNKVGLVSAKYGEKVIPVIVTHFATKKLMEEAKKAEFLVIQSFEW